MSTTADVRLLEGVPRAYAWGSTTAIQQLLGRTPDGSPLAELWYGAHPDGPSPADGTTLDAVVQADPGGTLGADTVARFGPQLPFLVKILAADRPLSIQVHPTRAQAEAGFDREDAAGVPRDAPQRNYRDRNHKPELLCALTEFDALCGFRPVTRTVALLDHLAVPGLQRVRDLLVGADGLRAAFTCLLTLPDAAPLVAEVAERAGAPAPAEFAGALRAVRLAAAEFPGDAGVLVTLLLNDVRLRPGDAIFLGAGNVHAYLRGVGVEIMAASDNVVRAGLTPKHVDVSELLAITDFRELAEPRWPDRGDESGVVYRPPVPDFVLSSVDLDAYRNAHGDRASYAVGSDGRPYLVLCTSGAPVLQTGSGGLPLAPGRAAFVPAARHGVTLVGTGTCFLATVDG
jgi:mannose-6-phosphate isomerase